LANGSGAPSARNLERGRRHRASPTEGTRSSKKLLALTRGDGSGSIERKRQFRLPPPIASRRVEPLVASDLNLGRFPEKYASILRRPTDDSGRKQRSRQVGKGVSGSSQQDCPSADKATAAPLRLRASAGAALLSDPKPVVRRQTRDRWRLDDRKVVRRLHERSAETPRSQDPRFGRRRVSHGKRRVSKSGASAGARHANVGCRNEFEASWRCAQVEPQGETSRSVERR